MTTEQSNPSTETPCEPQTEEYRIVETGIQKVIAIELVTMTREDFEDAKAQVIKDTVATVFYSLSLKAQDIERRMLDKELADRDPNFCAQCEISAFYELFGAVNELKPKEAKADGQ